MSALPRACVLGLGSMGAAMGRRLRDRGHNISVYNRSPARAQDLAKEEAPGSCVVSSTPASAIRVCAEGALALVVVLDTATVIGLLREEGVGEAIRGKTLVNLASGNPDDARAVAAVVAEVSRHGANFLDGAYCGNPTKARSGTGQVYLSSEEASLVEDARPLLKDLGSVTFAGGIGASRALDYAVVDLFFMNLLSLMSNAEAMQREGVDMRIFVEEAKKRLDTVPGTLEMYHRRMASRDEAAYHADVTCSLGTARSYWASRLPYTEAQGIPTDVTDFMLRLLDAASSRGHADADVSRLQEVVRYGVPGSSGAPPTKKPRRD